MILAGDLGGTNTRLALFDTDPRLPVAVATSPTRADLPLERLIRDFLAEHRHRVERAAFGIAGVVADGRSIETTNLPGPVDAAALAAACDLDGVVLLNDVEASAHALALLGPTDLATRLALDGDDGEASRALDALVSIYGAFAGNVALTLMAQRANNADRRGPGRGENGTVRRGKSSSLTYRLWDGVGSVMYHSLYL